MFNLNFISYSSTIYDLIFIFWTFQKPALSQHIFFIPYVHRIIWKWMSYTALNLQHTLLLLLLLLLFCRCCSQLHKEAGIFSYCNKLTKPKSSNAWHWKQYFIHFTFTLISCMPLPLPPCQTLNVFAPSVLTLTCDEFWSQHIGCAKIKYNHKERYSFTNVGITRLEWDVFLIASTS